MHIPHCAKQPDENQAPGGIEDDSDLKPLRGPLLDAPIGLQLLHRLINTMGDLDAEFIQQHVLDTSVPARPTLIHDNMAARAAPGSAVPHHTPASSYIYNTLNDELPHHLQDSNISPPHLTLYSPTATTLALLHLVGYSDSGLRLHQASTAMEAAGLEGRRKWGVILPTSAPVVESIYEPAIATVYPGLWHP